MFIYVLVGMCGMLDMRRLVLTTNACHRGAKQREKSWNVEWSIADHFIHPNWYPRLSTMGKY
jgi:hypothetical protein